MGGNDAPFHAHVYFDACDPGKAAALRDRFLQLLAPGSVPQILFVGRMVPGPVGPHPLPQYEVHFAGRSRQQVIDLIGQFGVHALVHPLTDDDLADHTTLGEWFGPPLDLDLGVLDPPGINQGMPRFGKSDF